jgi:cytochrome P450
MTTDTTLMLAPATLPKPFAGEAGRWPEAFGALREAGPVHLIALPNGEETWLVTRYAEVIAGLTDPRLAALPGAGLPPDHGLSDDIMHRIIDGQLLMMNGPEHARLRRLIARAFTPRRAEELRPRIEQITAERLDRLAGCGEFDVIEDLAFPVTMRVLGELLGLPEEDMPAFRAWALAYIHCHGAEVFPTAEITAFVGYLGQLVARKRENRDGALLSALIEVHDAEDGRLSETELTACVCLLIAAGFQTTTGAIANSVHHLLTHRGEADLLRAQPGTTSAVVERCLYLYPPAVISGGRIATEQVELGGVVIPPGALVLFSLLSANHESAGYDGRGAPGAGHEPAGPHVAFGHGAHYCLGASLARAQIQIVVSALLRRFPRLRLAIPTTEVKWVSCGIITLTPSRLPVIPGPDATTAVERVGHTGAGPHAAHPGQAQCPVTGRRSE